MWKSLASSILTLAALANAADASTCDEANLLQLTTLSPDEESEKETFEMMDKVDKALASSETIDAPPEAPAEAQVLADSEEVDPETPPAKASRVAAMVESDKRPKCVKEGKSGIIVVDMQNDFVQEDGSLPVAGAVDIIPTINKLVNELEWDFTTFTEDFHPRDHISFAVNSPLKKEPFEFVTLSYDQSLKICGSEYQSIYGPMAAGDCSDKIILASFEQELWPKHCIQNTEGQKFHADLEIPHDAFILRKGVNSIADSYGAFYDNIGMHLDENAPADISFQIETGLFGALQLAGVQQVFLTGVAEDYCVKYTALQALKKGFRVYLVSDATKPVSDATGEEALLELKKKGAKLIESCEVLGTCACSMEE